MALLGKFFGAIRSAAKGIISLGKKASEQKPDVDSFPPVEQNSQSTEQDPLNKEDDSKKWAYNGESFTVQEWASIYGISISAMRYRLRKFNAPEPTKEAPLSRGAIREAVLHEHDGRKQTISEWCKELGVTEATLRWRIKKYGSVVIPEQDNRIVAYKEAQVIKTDNGVFLEIDGKKMSLSEAAQAFGIKYHTLANRVWKGCSIKEILTKVRPSNRDYKKNPVSTAKQWEWKGESHTAKEWAEKFGVKLGIMRKRLKTNASPERDCSRRDAANARRTKKWEWNGESHSIAEWSKITGKSESALRSCLKKYGSPYVPECARLRRAPVAPPRAQDTITVQVNSPTIPPQEDDIKDNGELYGFEGEWKTLTEWSQEYGITRRECERNFTLYGEPTKPFYTADTESDDVDEANAEIDRILAECAQRGKPTQSIKEWLKEIANQPDDDTPLMAIIGVKDHYHTLDGKIPRFSIDFPDLTGDESL